MFAKVDRVPYGANATLAQSAERLTRNEKVESSILSGGSAWTPILIRSSARMSDRSRQVFLLVARDY